MRKLVLIVHNVRSAHNVGSVLRSADGFGVDRVYLCGYTPYPAGAAGDERLPHIASRVNDQIAKTALSAEKTVGWRYEADAIGVTRRLRRRRFTVVALEQSRHSIDIRGFSPANDIALLVGSEIGGLDEVMLAEADKIVQIPMAGSKESFNVAVAAAIALYHFRNP